MGVTLNHLNEISKQSNNQLLNKIYLGNDTAFAASRISYKLNLNGPVSSVNTACSSGLVALINACNILQQNEADIMIVGGGTLILPFDIGYEYQHGNIFSKTGNCLPLTNLADGTLPSCAIVAIAVKRLDDAIQSQDNIYAVIEGYAQNNDGNDKVSFTAPSFDGQYNCIKNAYKKANLSLSDVSYIEAHGTGTDIGDRIELKVLNKLISEETISLEKTIPIGSVKSNIGHSGTTAGLVGLVKCALMLKKSKLVPYGFDGSLDTDNKLLNFHLQMRTEILNNFKNHYMGISSFGVGGTNSHVILSDYKYSRKINNNTVAILPFSTKTQESHYIFLSKVLNFLNLTNENNKELLFNMMYTLQCGRKNFKFRSIFIVKSIRELKDKIANYLSTHINDNSNYKNNEIFIAMSDQWLSGKDVQWNKYFDHKGLHIISFPPHPFVPKYYWIKREYSDKSNQFDNNTPHSADLN